MSRILRALCISAHLSVVLISVQTKPIPLHPAPQMHPMQASAYNYPAPQTHTYYPQAGQPSTPFQAAQAPRTHNDPAQNLEQQKKDIRRMHKIQVKDLNIEKKEKKSEMDKGHREQIKQLKVAQHQQIKQLEEQYRQVIAHMRQQRLLKVQQLEQHYAQRGHQLKAQRDAELKHINSMYQ